jgi:hypothetical protein
MSPWMMPIKGSCRYCMADDISRTAVMRWCAGGGGSQPSLWYQLPPGTHSMTMKGSEGSRLAAMICTQCGGGPEAEGGRY